MAANGPDPNAPKKGGLFARLFSVNPPPKKGDGTEEKQPPAPETPPPASESSANSPSDLLEDFVPLDAGALEEPRLPDPPPEEVILPFPDEIALQPIPPEQIDLPPAAAPEDEPPPAAIPVFEAIPLELSEPEIAAPAPVAKKQAANCPMCQAPRKDGSTFCDDCGWMFPEDLDVSAAFSPAPVAAIPNSTMLLKERYEIRELITQRGEVARLRGLDHASNPPAPVVIVRETLQELPVAVLPEEEEPIPTEDILPEFDKPVPMARIDNGQSAWPGIAWERQLLERAQHPSLPRVVESFADGEFDYVIEEVPAGSPLWDAWDDPDSDANVRYGWLVQLAEALHELHQAGAILEGLRPDLVVVTDGGQAVLSDLADLLPLPVPAGAQLRASLYTAPELVLDPQKADARADLFSFGAMLYALEYLHHDLEEKDFEAKYQPKQITDRYPDVHPLFFRLICKTFVKDVNTRFPTDEASKEDPTGFVELHRVLGVCRDTLDNVRLDIAAWTTTGMVRTGNEDAFALMQAIESRQDELNEYALIVLADGMGGYEAGEVAAAMAIQALRKYLVQQPLFSALAGNPPPEGPFDVQACEHTLQEALKHANREVYAAARSPGRGRRGMGCTAEVVYVDAHHLVVGHVGDSRTYHLHNGRLHQLTRDQTFVNRMVELGQLTPEEAENHPRKNELQQAIGGQPDVQPGLYHAWLQRGDWVIVCSDGLTNHIAADELLKMLERETSGSAEEAARRLTNLVNLRGATDNSTLVVVRAS
jgi:serine/threonine protein phosphatase PrpC